MQRGISVAGTDGRSPRHVRTAGSAADFVEPWLNRGRDLREGIRGVLGVELDRALGLRQRIPVDPANRERRPAVSTRKQVEEDLVLGVVEGRVCQERLERR